MDTRGARRRAPRGAWMQPDESCAYCGRRPVDPAWRPFCSERCKLADLGRWLSGDYLVPGPPVPPHDDDNDAE